MKPPKNEIKKKTTGECKCRKCVSCIAWELLEDQESDPFWIEYAGKTGKYKSTTVCKHECGWWVHNRCANIYYENSDSGERAMST